jgi:hypothetical protein
MYGVLIFVIPLYVQQHELVLQLRLLLGTKD